MRVDAPAIAPELPTDVVEFLDAVWARYKDYSAGELWRLTHSQDPWKRNFVSGSHRRQIPDKDMVDYFRQRVPAEERLFHPNVVVMPENFLDDDDADRFAAKLAEFAPQ